MLLSFKGSLSTTVFFSYTLILLKSNTVLPIFTDSINLIISYVRSKLTASVFFCASDSLLNVLITLLLIEVSVMRVGITKLHVIPPCLTILLVVNCV